ncbi:TRAP transporter small permease [Brevibacillus sp. AY1]|uniref:TRAP transporter small permease n=1 Tax=Brevibacillus sp. AY1 TaxID=2807621 RepID=UPI002457C445|nr:TRAP transporter small permease [Brevibacillus sp. AY1]MDH4619850.1 TRAP transporter small permease [Brevibacillus sp. AY1]
MLAVPLVDRINKWVFNGIAVIFGLAALLTLVQVFARYLLKSPFVWSEELVRYAMIWIVFLGTAVALRKGHLIAVEVVQHLVPKAIKKMMEVVTVLINMVLLFLLIKYGFGIMTNLGGQSTGAMDIPVSWTYAAIPVGSLLALLNSLVALFEIFTKKEEDKHGGDLVL